VSLQHFFGTASTSVNFTLPTRETGVQFLTRGTPNAQSQVHSLETPLRNENLDFGYNLQDARAYASRGGIPSVPLPYGHGELPGLTDPADVMTSYHRASLSSSPSSPAQSYHYTGGGKSSYYSNLGQTSYGGSNGYGEDYVDYSLGCTSAPVLNHEQVGMVPSYSWAASAARGTGKNASGPNVTTAGSHSSGLYVVDPDAVGYYASSPNTSGSTPAGTPTSPGPSSGNVIRSQHAVSSHHHYHRSTAADSPPSDFSFSNMAAQLPGGTVGGEHDTGTLTAPDRMMSHSTAVVASNGGSTSPVSSGSSSSVPYHHQLAVKTTPYPIRVDTSESPSPVSATADVAIGTTSDGESIFPKQENCLRSSGSGVDLATYNYGDSETIISGAAVGVDVVLRQESHSPPTVGTGRRRRLPSHGRSNHHQNTSGVYGTSITVYATTASEHTPSSATSGLAKNEAHCATVGHH
jgi:hypothetical protein